MRRAWLLFIIGAGVVWWLLTRSRSTSTTSAPGASNLAPSTADPRLDKFRGMTRKLNDYEVAELCYLVGFTALSNTAEGVEDADNDLVTATRIVFGESRSNPLALNYNEATETNDASRDRGLFQINDLAHPSMSDAECFDPVTCALYAFKVYKKQGGFRPGNSAWWGATKFHTLKRAPGGKSMVRDDSRINRARLAVGAVLAVYLA